jgi:hypothetical protein
MEGILEKLPVALVARVWGLRLNKNGWRRGRCEKGVINATFFDRVFPSDR